GRLFLEHELKDGFPLEFLGVQEFREVKGTELAFKLPGSGRPGGPAGGLETVCRRLSKLPGA
ncbi:MAG: hypothetical protein M0028_02710, partial [Clostridia bacterium]|nr:hypothetical protein [Clostridia bacterium]